MVDRTQMPSVQETLPYNLKQTETHYLENGTPVHFLVSGSQAILRVEFIFPAGTWFENLSGLSYVASKMILEGTRLKSAREIADFIALHGAFIETHQGFENLNITVYLLEKHLSEILPVLFEIFQLSTFPETELENFKTVTNQSIKVNKEKTQYLASVNFRKLVFGETQPYGRQYWENDISLINRDQVIKFAEQFIKESHCEVFVSGGFSVSNVIAQLNSFFTEKANSKALFNLLFKEESISDNDLCIIEKSTALQSSIRVGCKTIERSNPDFIPLLVVNEILGGFFGSRLMKNIREEKGFTYGIHSSVNSLMKGAYFVISTDVKKENTQETLNEIFREIEILKSETIPLTELRTVTSYMLGRFMNSLNTPFALMDKFKTIYFGGQTYGYYDQFKKVVSSIQPEEIKTVASRYLDPDKMTKVVVGGL